MTQTIPAAKYQHFHACDARTEKWEFDPNGAIISYLRRDLYYNYQDVSRCFAVQDAIGIVNDLANNRPVEYLGAVSQDVEGTR